MYGARELANMVLVLGFIAHLIRVDGALSEMSNVYLYIVGSAGGVRVSEDAGYRRQRRAVGQQVAGK